MIRRPAIHPCLVLVAVLALVTACSAPSAATGASTTVTTTVTASPPDAEPETVTASAAAGATVTVTEVSTAAITTTVTEHAAAPNSPAGTTTAATAPPTRQDHLAGNAKPSQLPKIKADGLFQSFYGHYHSPGAGLGGTVPFVLRNDSGHTLYHVQVTGSATDPGGAIVGSGSSQEVVPNAVPAGGLAIGYVYFDGDKVTTSSTFDFEPTADSSPSEFGSAIDLDVTGLNNTGNTLLGKVTNNTSSKATGPISIDAMCFTAGGKILGSPAPGFAEKSDLSAGESSTFSVDLYDTECPTYLVGASGYAF